MRASNQLQRLSADELDALVLATVLNQPSPPTGKTTVQILVEAKTGANPYQVLASLHRLEAQGLIYHSNDPDKPRKYWWKPNVNPRQSATMR